VHAFVLVLVEDENVEPVVFVLQGSLELYPFIFKGHIKPFVFHVADALEGNLRASFSKENRDYFNILDIRDFAKIIDVIISAHQVYIRQVFKTGRVVMIPVDYKYRDADA